jgi:hypothetical protein
VSYKRSQVNSLTESGKQHKNNMIRSRKIETIKKKQIEILELKNIITELKTD